jgi:hypothetical protein
LLIFAESFVHQRRSLQILPFFVHKLPHSENFHRNFSALNLVKHTGAKQMNEPLEYDVQQELKLPAIGAATHGIVSDLM